MVATSQFLVYVAIVAFLVLVTVGDTVLIAILMYCFNRNNPPNCDTVRSWQKHSHHFPLFFQTPFI